MQYNFTPPRELKASDWKRMYTILLGSIDDALAVLPKTDDTRVARHILTSAMERAEEYYIQAGERRI